MALNKNQKLLLNDFLNDKTDLRLSLFVNSINTSFKIDKKSKEKILLLIKDYELSPIPARLKIIETFIGAGVSDSVARIKPSQIKNNTITKTQKEAPQKNEELQGLYRLAASLRQTKNFDLNEEYIKTMNKIRVFEMEAGLYDPKPPEQSQLDLVLGALGHWDDEGSIAYELIHGQRSKVSIESGVDIASLIKWLGELSGQTVRQFYVQGNELYGSMSQGNKQPVYTLTDARYGAPEKNNFVTMVDGKVSGLNLSKMVQSPNLGAPTWAAPK